MNIPMKKTRNIAIIVVFAIIAFFFPNQNHYYLTDDLVTLNTTQGVIIASVLLVLLIALAFWSRKQEEPWYNSIAKGFWWTFSFVVIGLLVIQPTVKHGALLINRMHSYESVTQKHEVFRRYGVRIPDFTSETKDTIYVRFKDKFPQFYDENREQIDSVVIQFEKGLLGYYYINQEKSEIIVSQNR
jgi:uncharacterized membrane protein